MDKEVLRSKIDEIIREMNISRFVNPQRTLELGKEAFIMSEEIEYEFGKAILMLRIGEAYGNVGKYEEAVEYTFNSLDLFVKEGIYDLLAAAYVQLGIIFTELADYERSMDFYNAAGEIAEEIDDGNRYDKNISGETVTAIVLNNIAEIYRLLKDYDEAMACYKISMTIDEKLNYRPSKGVSLLNLGEMHYIMGDYNEALNFINKALKFMNLYNYKLGEWEVYGVLAMIHWKLGQYEKVEEYYRYAINFTNEELSPYCQIEALTQHYEYLKDRGRIDEAMEELRRACTIALDNSVIEKVPEITALLASLFEEMGNGEEAFKYYKLYRQYEIEYHESLVRQRINSLKARKRLDEISREKREIERKNEELKRKSEELEEIVKNISIISELGQKITSTLNLQTLVKILYDSINDFMKMTTFGISLYDETNKIIKPLQYMGKKSGLRAPEISIENRNSVLAHCIRKKEVIIINDLDKELPQIIENMDKLITLGIGIELRSAVFCPLIVNDCVIGVMTIQDERKNAFSAYHVEMIRALSAYAAIAVNNAIKSMNLEMEIEGRKRTQLELELANEKLVYLSENDGMTGIPNRRKFDDNLNNLWDSALRDRERICLILCDIDSFKEFNDNYGHVEGDRCIIEVARAINEEAKEKYFAARYGGDEFAVVMYGCGIEEAMDLGETLRKRVEQLNLVHHFSKVSDRVTITLGTACIIPQNEDTINEFIRKTDNALYEAKKRGRNQIAGFSIREE